MPAFENLRLRDPHNEHGVLILHAGLTTEDWMSAMRYGNVV